MVMLEWLGLSIGAWLSLVEHLVRDQGVGGSNPLAPIQQSSLHQLIAASADDAAISAVKAVGGVVGGLICSDAALSIAALTVPSSG